MFPSWTGVGAHADTRLGPSTDCLPAAPIKHVDQPRDQVVPGGEIAPVIRQQELTGDHLKTFVSLPLFVSILALRKISNISFRGIR
jgi:hypothetical protein